jgi:hypothetical protein
MSTRRTFLLSTSVATTLPAMTAALSVSGNARASNVSVSDPELTHQMTGKLEAQLNDPATAAIEVPRLQDIFFTWSLPLIPAAEVSTIVAYSFGDRPNPANGSTYGNSPAESPLPAPGPVNEQIANAVYTLHRVQRVMIFAQWEVASILRSKYQMNNSNLQSVLPPVVAGDGTVTYPGVAEVASAIIALRGSAAALGTVAVVTHRDQAKSAIQTSRMLGMTAHAALEITLPVDYDAQASQPVNRRRDLYLLSDMSNQFATLRTNLIAQQYPQG